MNRKSWLSILITALVGVLLIVFYNQGQILTWVVTLFGVCLIIPAAYNLYSTLRVRKQLQLEEKTGSDGRRMPDGFCLRRNCGECGRNCSGHMDASYP